MCVHKNISWLTFLPLQMVPLPVNPGLQEQLCPPTVLKHSAFTSQLCWPDTHSSCSKTEVDKKEIKVLMSNEFNYFDVTLSVLHLLTQD